MHHSGTVQIWGTAAFGIINENYKTYNYDGGSIGLKLILKQLIKVDRG